jgi:hypothetical protein
VLAFLAFSPRQAGLAARLTPDVQQVIADLERSHPAPPGQN